MDMSRCGLLRRLYRLENLKAALEFLPVSPSGKKRGHDAVAVLPVECQLPGEAESPSSWSAMFMSAPAPTAVSSAFQALDPATTSFGKRGAAGGDPRQVLRQEADNFPWSGRAVSTAEVDGSHFTPYCAAN